MCLIPEQRGTIDTAVSSKEASATQCDIDPLRKGRRDVEEEAVLKLPSDSFDEFLAALDAPMNDRAIAMLKMEPEWAG